MERKALRDAISKQYHSMYVVGDVNMVRESDIDDIVNAILYSLEKWKCSNCGGTVQYADKYGAIYCAKCNKRD